MAKIIGAGIKEKLHSLLKAAWESNDHKELRILVTGKTGEGKSTLVNGLLGANVAKEGADMERCTTEVLEYCHRLHGVPVTVIDSPGLQDNTGNEDEYLKDMKKKFQNLSLVIYCMKMTSHRLRDEDRHAMLTLTATFGEKFWKHTVVILTFANKEDVTRRDERDEDKGPEPRWDDAAAWKDLEKKRFAGRLKKWEDGLYKFFIEKVGMSAEIAERIKIVPAGDHRPTRQNEGKPLRLPDREDWFHDVWVACAKRVKEMNLFFDVNRHRVIVDETTASPHTATSSNFDDLTAKEKEDLTKGFEIIKKEAITIEATGKLQASSLTSGLQVRQGNTYTPKLQENIKKMDKETWLKEQEEKIRKEKENVTRQAEEKRKEIERQAEKNQKEMERWEEEIRKEKEKIKRQEEENRKAEEEIKRQAEEKRKEIERQKEKIRKEKEEMKKQEEERKEKERQFRQAEVRRKIERYKEEREKQLRETEERRKEEEERKEREKQLKQVEERRKEMERQAEEIRKEKEKIRKQEEEIRKERVRQLRQAEERSKEIEKEAEEKRKEIEQEAEEKRKEIERQAEVYMYIRKLREGEERRKETEMQATSGSDLTQKEIRLSENDVQELVEESLFRKFGKNFVNAATKTWRVITSPVKLFKSANNEIIIKSTPN